MRSTTVRRALLAGATFTAALILAAGCGDDNGYEGSSGGSTTPTGPAAAQFNEADVAFAQNMIVHHEQAIEMAALAQTRASDQELVEVADQIRQAQGPEITTMTDLLTAWGRPVEPSGGHEGMTMPGMAAEHEMAALEQSSGVEFDRMFTELMIAHHRGAVEMAGEVQNSGVNLAIEALAATVEQDQQTEIEQLEGIQDRL
jgi:uncharacterized protein (DUF305 family)